MHGPLGPGQTCRAGQFEGRGQCRPFGCAIVRSRLAVSAWFVPSGSALSLFGGWGRGLAATEDTPFPVPAAEVAGFAGLLTAPPIPPAFWGLAFSQTTGAAVSSLTAPTPSGLRGRGWLLLWRLRSHCGSLRWLLCHQPWSLHSCTGCAHHRCYGAAPRPSRCRVPARFSPSSLWRLRRRWRRLCLRLWHRLSEQLIIQRGQCLFLLPQQWPLWVT